MEMCVFSIYTQANRVFLVSILTKLFDVKENYLGVVIDSDNCSLCLFPHRAILTHHFATTTGKLLWEIS